MGIAGSARSTFVDSKDFIQSSQKNAGVFCLALPYYLHIPAKSLKSEGCLTVSGDITVEFCRPILDT